MSPPAAPWRGADRAAGRLARMGWRPLPRDDRDPPAPVGDVVEHLLRHLGAPAPDALDLVFGQWESLVGARIAAQAEPVAINAGTLAVRATDPAWGNQLRWLEQDLLTRLAAVLGPDVVTAIEVRVGPAGRAPRRRSTRGRRG
jgi:predicted nucleic acid-binding Zn ribbon protein